jgi:hypothetical protein
LRIDSAVTDLPEPDSPTSASVSPRFDLERDALDRVGDIATLAEIHRQVGHLQQCFMRLAHANVFLGSNESRTASPMNTSSDSMTDTTAKPVSPSQGACRLALP